MCTNVPSNGILCKLTANFYSNFMVTGELRVAAGKDVELMSRFARLFCEFFASSICN